MTRREIILLFFIAMAGGATGGIARELMVGFWKGLMG